jgi:outer membrane lipoprotein-sorting protein
MIPLPEKDLADAHKLFHRGHAEQRARLMAALSQTVERRTEKISPRTIPLPLRLTAAGLLIAATVALLSLSPGGRAYGIEGLKERLFAIRSLHLKGWIYHYRDTDSGRVPLAFPTEWFYERPCRRYGISYSFSDNGKELKVTSGVIASDGEQTIVIDKDNNTATFTPADKLQSELLVEGSLQTRLFQELGKANLDDFEKVAAERVNDLECVVYELKSNGQPGGQHADGPHDPIRFRTRLWLNPQDGMPVKVAGYMIKPAGDEIFWEWTEIGINVDPPPGMFSFEIPAGFERIEGEKPNEAAAIATLSGGGGMGANGISAAVSSGVALNIDDKSVLYCWSVRTTGKDGVQWFDGQPEFSLDDGDKRPCQEITLRTDDFGERQSRWSLIVPRDRRPLGNATMGMVYRLGRSTSSMNVSPLEFRPKRLAEIVEEVQRRTLPPNHDTSEIWTLDKLRQKVAEVR